MTKAKMPVETRSAGTIGNRAMTSAWIKHQGVIYAVAASEKGALI